MKVRIRHRLVLASLALGSVFALGSPATQADPPKPRPDPFAAEVEAALGVDPDAVIPALEGMAERSWNADVSVAVAVAVLSRAHWQSDPRGVDVRVKAIEVLGRQPLSATGALGFLERVVIADGADERIQVAGRKALASTRRLADPARREAILKSIDNVRTMILFYTGAGAGLEMSWPKYGGKRFVLWLVATNRLTRSDATWLSILFSPGDGARSLEKAGGLKAYASLTLPTLKDPAIDVSALTSYAGRRNAEKEHILSAAEQMANAPVLADFSFPGGVVLGYCGGAARWVSAEELGLPPDEPIVVGDASPIEMLKHLSDR